MSGFSQQEPVILKATQHVAAFRDVSEALTPVAFVKS